MRSCFFSVKNDKIPIREEPIPTAKLTWWYFFSIIEESYVISIPYQIYNVIGSFSMFLSAKTCLRKSPEFHRFLMIFRSKTGSAIFCESSFFNQKNMFPRSYPQNFGFFRKLNEISFKCIIPEDNPIPELGERTLQTRRKNIIFSAFCSSRDPPFNVALRRVGKR